MRPTYLLAAGLIAATVTLPAHPAGAGATMTFGIEIHDDVLYPGCGSIYYSIQPPELPPNTDNWTVDLVITDENGAEVSTDQTYAAPGEDSFDSFFLCSEEGPGVFTVRGDGNVYLDDEDYTNIPFTFEDTFELRRPTSLVSLSARPANPKPNTTVRLTAQVLVEDHGGPDAGAFATVALQRRSDGRWVTVGKPALADQAGKAVLSYRYRKGKIQLRARATLEDYTPSVSPTVVLR